MKNILTILAALLVSTAAFADVAPSENPVDFGIASGALNSKVFRVKAGKTNYAVIGVDLVEPACNSTQAVIWVSDDSLEGDAGGVAYNLGVQISSILSVKTKGDEVVITVRRNDVSDCSKGIKETYAIQYTGNAGKLSVKKSN
ncbi:MAG: hypothetical protein ACXWQO_19450 [Bdellovibrionota bacterium]